MREILFGKIQSKMITALDESQITIGQSLDRVQHPTL